MSHLPVIDRQGQLGRAPPTNLYDLLGARPDGDAEELKIAFRRALKANHPDLHPGDPDAPVRVSGIVRAYAILRDPQERAAYDRALGIGCEPPPRAKRSIFETIHIIISEAVAVVVLALVLGAGYALLGEVLETSLAAYKLANATLHEPADIAVLQPALMNRTGEQTDKHEGGVVATVAIAPSGTTPAAKSDDALTVANAKPTSSLPERAVKVVENSGSATKAHTETTTNHFKKNHEAERPDQHQKMAPSVRVNLPSLEYEKKLAISSSYDFDKSSQKHHMKTRDLKAPAIHGKPWAVATRHPDHAHSHRPRAAMRHHFPLDGYSIYVPGHSTEPICIHDFLSECPMPGILTAENSTFG